MSKRHNENLKQVDRDKTYSLEDAVGVLKGTSPAKFDETVEMALNLKIDPAHAEQAVRGSFSFPNGVGRNVRVIAITDEAKAAEAKEAGALEAGGEELVKRIEEGWLDFDVVVAQPAMMRVIGKLGRMLGPKGLMPSPKSGTVTDDIAGAVKEFGAGKIEYRNDRQGNILVPVGKLSFDPQALVDNARAFYDHIVTNRPPAVKGVFIKSVFISSTMGPGLRLAL
jgi:large subunit ribosomal protein L1